MSLIERVGPLQKDDPTPLYLQLQKILRDAIEGQVVKAEEAIPTERDLAAKVELAARMACADSWRPRSTIYESIDYTVDWSGADGTMPGRRKAVARNISVRCRL